MNRMVVAACFVGLLGTNALACSVTGVGDPCIPEDEFNKNSGSAQPSELIIDVNSVQCETRVCLKHYFKGRVSCPYGNGGKISQTGKCQQTKDAKGAAIRGLFTIDGTRVADGGVLCCPVLGDVEEAPIKNPVDAQCSGRPAKEAVYCSCRCDVPSDPEINRDQVNLCKCPDGYACVELCDQKHGGCSVVPKGKWGSYCVKAGALGSTFDPDTMQDTKCGLPLEAPL